MSPDVKGLLVIFAFLLLMGAIGSLIGNFFDKLHNIAKGLGQIDDHLEELVALIENEQFLQYMKNRDGLEVDETPQECGAVIYCGPGHQTGLRCEVLGPHVEHVAIHRNEVVCWHTKEDDDE